MTKAYIDLEQSWVFYPVYDGSPFTAISEYTRERFEQELRAGRIIEIDGEFLDRYQKASEEYWKLNGELEELYRAHFMNKRSK